MRSIVLRVFGAVAIGVMTASCGDQPSPTAPASVSGPASSNLLGLLSGATSVRVVNRNTPLTAPQTATTTIGLLGGRLSLPGAGLTIVVPALAVRSGTRITVTALPGRAVAYEFQPHGLRFLLPLIATQDLANTDAVKSGLLSQNLLAAYFENSSDINLLDGTALVSELLGSTLNLVSKKMVFGIPHFSGWLIATGRQGVDDAADALLNQ